MTPLEEVDVVTPEEISSAVERALGNLNMTYEELQNQAKVGRFSSERARLTWFAIRDLAA